MNDENMMSRNKRNDNNFSEGKTNRVIRDPAVTYEYGAYSTTKTPPSSIQNHQCKMSIACQSGTDIMHSIGNVTAIMLQFILDQFPSGTFSTALPSTKLAHRQLRHTPKQIRTQSYPMCIVNPRVSLPALDNRFTAGSFATTTWSSTSDRFQNRSEMERLLSDPRIGIEWRGKINRVVLYLDFVLAFRSISEQIRWASYLQNKLPTDGSFMPDIETALELAIPDGFLKATSDYIKIPIRDEHGSVAPFVDYLNMHTTYPVSYRFSSGRHTDAFYINHGSSLLCSISEFNYSNTTKNGQVDVDCPITFTLRCEYNTIGLFDLCHPSDGPTRIVHDSPMDVIIPIFSDSFNEKDFPLAYGWVIHAKPICKLDWDEREISLDPILDESLNRILNFHLENHLNPELFISIKLRENREIIDDGYYVDWKNRKLVFTTVNYTHTYRLIVALNRLYIQDMLTSLYGK